MNTRAAQQQSRDDRALQEGRDAFRNHQWGTAYARLSASDSKSPLQPPDLVLLAQAAQLTGRDSDFADLLARAHHALAECGHSQPAARCAFWLGFTAMLAGEFAKAGGWLSRASRLLEGQPDCAENGYLLLATGYRTFHSGDPTAAHTAFVQAAACGERFREMDLLALALQGQGRALIRQGEIARGVALLDEAMVAVTAGEVSPLSAGGVYCSVLDACGEIFDLQRAQEWTSALDQWCASQPELVPFRGHCLIRRSELLQLHGTWAEALECAEQAADWLSRPAPKRGLGAALYPVGEIHRLRGNLDEAERAFETASEWMRSPGPGLARLRLAQGRIEAADATIRRLEQDVRSPGARARVLEAYVDILLATHDAAAARDAAEELSAIAGAHEIPFLKALSSGSSGAVLLQTGRARDAMLELRQAWDLWCELQAPYEAARVRCRMGQACRAVGNEEEAIIELTAAQQAFERLGAALDLSTLKALLLGGEDNAAGPLTGREVEVLRQIASGLSNRAIASELGISEKTVARHISNIFNKLDVSSRTAAAAYAYDHKLV